MRGRGFFFTTERGEGTRNQWGREGVKFENGSKAVSALSFIFTVSVLNSSLAYVTMTWCCCWCSWVYELELLLTRDLILIWYWCSWMYRWKMVCDEHSYICYSFCLFPSHLGTVKNKAQCFFFYYFSFFIFWLLRYVPVWCYCCPNECWKLPNQNPNISPTVIFCRTHFHTFH